MRQGARGNGAPLVVETFAEWRDAARALLADNVPPHALSWQTHADAGDLFSTLQKAGTAPAAPAAADSEQDLAQSVAPTPVAPMPVAPMPVAPTPAAPTPAAPTPAAPTPAAPDYSHAAADTSPAPASDEEVPRLRLPRSMLEMLASAACFRASDRWAFLYRIVWRWQQGEKAVLSAADEDGARLHAMVKAVRREEHDMHAYVRFRERPEEAGPPRFVAWYEPAHDVLPQVARHFARRMGRMSWMIATPDATMLWDGDTLHAAGPAPRPDAAGDDGEALWLTYYRSIFNPARLNTRVMHSHIPARSWKNLPEGQVVPAMVAEAATGARRVGQTQTVSQRAGTVIPVAAERAMPQREAPRTLDQCRRCDLWQNATQAVPGRGPAQARIMLVGEQPGDQEDLAGQPFIGPAGQLLDRVLADAMLDRRTLYLTNAVKHFKWEPRGKRRLHKTPAQMEIMACRHWLEEEIAHVSPQVIVAMGSTALQGVLGSGAVKLTPLLGKPFQHAGRWIVAIYHPAYVLRVPDEAAKAQALRIMTEGLRQAARLLAQDGAPPV